MVTSSSPLQRELISCCGSNATCHQLCACSKCQYSCGHDGAFSNHEPTRRKSDPFSGHRSTCHAIDACPKNCSSCHTSTLLGTVVSRTDWAMTHQSRSRSALLLDRAMTHNSHSTLSPQLHRSPQGHTLLLATHQHRVSRNFLSLARRCLAALAAGVKTIFTGSDCGCCSMFTKLRKLSSTTSGSTPHPVPSVDAPQFANAFSLLCTPCERKHRWQPQSPPGVSSQESSHVIETCCAQPHHWIPISSPHVAPQVVQRLSQAEA